MTEEKLIELLSLAESELLDFKRCHYKLDSKSDDDAKFIKDIISFSNTIRESSSYIIIGVGESEGTKELLGLDNHIDESILQNKLKDKVRPIPKFNYHIIDHQDKRFGIIEIPVNRYSAPVMPIVKMRGLEVGKIYFRRGSSNSEANHIEVIDIHKWITTVIPNHSVKEINDSISDLISNISANEYYSPFLPKAIEIGKIIQNADLVQFGTKELTGWKLDNSAASNHRSIKSLVSLNQITHARYPTGTPLSHMWIELKARGDFFERDLTLSDPVGQIENSIKGHRLGAGNQFTSFKMKAREFFDEDYENGDHDIYVYWNENDFASMYNRSKQRLIELLTLSLI